MFGPDPKKAFWERAPFETFKVAEKDGLTSIFETLKTPATTSLNLPRVEEIVGLMRKIIEIIPRIIGRKVFLRAALVDT